MNECVCERERKSERKRERDVKLMPIKVSVYSHSLAMSPLPLLSPSSLRGGYSGSCQLCSKLLHFLFHLCFLFLLPLSHLDGFLELVFGPSDVPTQHSSSSSLITMSSVVTPVVMVVVAPLMMFSLLLLYLLITETYRQSSHIILRQNGYSP